MLWKTVLRVRSLCCSRAEAGSAELGLLGSAMPKVNRSRTAASQPAPMLRAPEGISGPSPGSRRSAWAPPCLLDEDTVLCCRDA